MFQNLGQVNGQESLRLLVLPFIYQRSWLRSALLNPLKEARGGQGMEVNEILALGVEVAGVKDGAEEGHLRLTPNCTRVKS